MRVVTFGEALLRLSPPGPLRLEQARTLELWPAGAELNVAVGLARLGTEAAWVSVLPRGPLGELLLAHARSFGVNVSGVLRADGRMGLYFVELAEPPPPSRALYDRAGSAFAGLDPAAFDWPSLREGAAAFHVSGITAVLGEGCSRAAARAAGWDAGGTRAASSPSFRATEPIGAGDAFSAGFLHGLLTEGVERGLELGGVMAAVKQAVPGDAPVVGPEELELALEGDARMRR
jgi:2-dehydro-3-deoxygluconokinase